jgi:hypothetical protein
MTSFFDSLIPFLPFFCQLPTPEIPSIICWNCQLRNSTDLNDLLSPFYNLSTRAAQKHSSSIVACVRSRGKAFSQLCLTNGCICHISYRDTCSIIACGYYVGNGCFSASTVLTLSKYTTINIYRYIVHIFISNTIIFITEEVKL